MVGSKIETEKRSSNWTSGPMTAKAKILNKELVIFYLIVRV